MVRIAKIYQINLIRSLRERERKAEQQRRFQALVGLSCFAILILAMLYSGFTMWKMERVLSSEELKLAQVRNEYKKYTATRMIVDKDDVELLNSLQGRGIFWTKKLAAMAKHLPDNYAITGFSYLGGELKVVGFGYVAPKQDQLLTLDTYLNALRADTTFSDEFTQLYLNGTERKEDIGPGKISFEFSAINPRFKGK